MIDGHMHFTRDLGLQAYLKLLGELEGAALLCIPKGMRRDHDSLPDAAALRDACRKAGLRTELYLFGGMIPNCYTLPEKEAAAAIVSRTDALMAMGCSGIKLVEGKPNAVKDWQVPRFDGPVWDPFWRKAERERIPVIMHVNDPEDFWHGSPDAAPEEIEFRRRSGWLYDETFPDNEDQYAQLMTVLSRYPRLKLLFPHFFFLSKQLPRFAEILERYPYVMTDVTPGIELFLNLSDQIGEARGFFSRFSGRICYGTDIGARQVIRPEDAPLNMAETEARMRLVRGFLGSTEEYVLQPDAYYRGPRPHIMQPLCLSPEQREQVFGGSFRRFLQRE